MAWLPDNEKNLEMCLFILIQSTNVRDKHTGRKAPLNGSRMCQWVENCNHNLNPNANRNPNSKPARQKNRFINNDVNKINLLII